MARTSAATEQGRADAFDSFLKEFNSNYGDDIKLRALSDPYVAHVEVIPSGVISLDVALGTGGLPRSRVTEIYGPTGGGKTTLALTAARVAQMSGGRVAFIDCEHALNRSLTQSIGIDETNFFVTQPDFGEQVIDMVERMLNADAFDMIVVDSVAAMTPKSVIEADVEATGQLGRHAALMSKFMGRVTSLVGKTNTAVVLLNQVRVDVGSYGAPEKSTGGKAIEFYTSVRIEVRTSNSKRIQVGKEYVGTRVTATVKKNKFASPYKVAEYDVIFGKGISASGALLDAAESVGVITRAGASYTDASTGERIGVGKDNVKGIIEADPELQQRLTDLVYAALGTDSTPDIPGSLIDELASDTGDDVDVAAAA